MIEAFGDQLAGLAAKHPTPEQAGDEAGRLRAIAAELAAGGWFDVATDDDSSFTLLCALAEKAGSGGRPFAFPLLETWTALRVLAAMPGRAGSGVSPDVLTIAADPLCGNEVSKSSGAIPFAAAATGVVLVVPQSDGSARVHLTTPEQLSLVESLAVDPAVPAWHVEDLAGLDRGEVGTLPAEEAGRLAAEYLCLQAAEIAGATRTLLDRTVTHLRSRQQFGTALAGFQALRHRAADMLVDVESIRSLAWHAAWAVQAGIEDHTDYALTAKGFAGERGIRVADAAVQLHGGIGFTWEAGLHWATTRIAYRAVTGKHSGDALAAAGANAMRRGAVLAGITPDVRGGDHR